MKMNAKEITERINKAQDNLNRLMNTIAKREAKLEKLNAMLAKETDRQKKERIQWDIDDEEYALSENKSKIAERKEKIQYWQVKLESANAECKRLMEIPEQLKELKVELEKDITETNINLKNQMWAERDQDSDGFYKKYNAQDRELMWKSDSEIERDAKHEAKMWVLNLISRVEKKVGEITNWKVYIATKSLNGIVEGTRGKVKIETIGAGGYNIQCFHHRVLVNRVK